ncbi:MAG: VWA domain-containing protein [Acidobacteria bacterium]|nr:VWA domain-containing protein [Acidobacteriota bacterium]
MRILNRHVSKDISAYLQNELTSVEASYIKSHLASCKSCQKECEEIEQGIFFAKELSLAKCPDFLWHNIARQLNSELNPQLNFQPKVKNRLVFYNLFSVKTWVTFCATASILIIFLPFFNSIFSSDPSNSINSFTALASNVETSGALESYTLEGRRIGYCALAHTDVKATITGFTSYVKVTQHFVNTSNEKIEALYTFPLPQNAAIDGLTMIVGNRVIKGEIKERQEAKATYEQARREGQIASLLDQERPNIFTQHVTNILPNSKIKVTISYIEVLKYDKGNFEFVFPTVVGPRYIPKHLEGNSYEQNLDSSAISYQAQNMSRITPPLSPTRTGHDLSIEVSLDSGVDMKNLTATHNLDIYKKTPHTALIKLKSQNIIPNKDFVLKYNVLNSKIQDGVLTYMDEQQRGFFSLILQPPDQILPTDIRPKELVFLVDTSGSMSGFPLEKAKETINFALNNLNAQDRFNLITFSGDTEILFDEPVIASRENLEKAKKFLANRSGGGGTEMMKAICKALEPSDHQENLRIVCFLTDGYVGNDFEIISEVQKHANARIFPFGIGNSVNRFLLDKIAEYGRGEAEYLMLQDSSSDATKRFYEKIHNPLLTDISIDWNNLPITDIYPKEIPDLFSAKPLVITGRFSAKDTGIIKLKGKLGDQEYTRDITINLSQTTDNLALAKLWARKQIDELMGLDYNALQSGNLSPYIKAKITSIGLEYSLLTEFTSFVAVDQESFTGEDIPNLLEIPLELPEGLVIMPFSFNFTRYSEGYNPDSRPQPTQTIHTPTDEEVRKKGVQPPLNPLPRYETSQPGNVLRAFERGSLFVGLPSGVGSPDPLETLSKSEVKVLSSPIDSSNIADNEEDEGEFVPIDERGRVGFLWWDRQTDRQANRQTRVHKVKNIAPKNTKKLSNPGYGNELLIDNKYNESKAIAINKLETPLLNSFLNGNTILINETSELLLSWSRVTNATSYKIEIALSPKFLPYEIIVSSLSSETKFNWLRLIKGKFYWRVKALYGNEVESNWSKAQVFHIESRVRSLPPK